MFAMHYVEYGKEVVRKFCGFRSGIKVSKGKEMDGKL